MIELKKNVLTLLFSILFGMNAFPQTDKIYYTPIPKWVTEQAFEKDSVKSDTVAQKRDFSLISQDLQLHIETEEIFYQRIYLLNNVAGLREFEYFSIEFDPKIHEIHLHKALLHRGKSTFDKLKGAHTEVVYQKKFVGGQPFAQAATLNIYFDDLSIGDWVEMAFTIKGQQKDMFGLFDYKTQAGTSYQLHRNHLRLLYKPSRKLFYYTGDSTWTPRENTVDGLKEWRWDFTNFVEPNISQAGDRPNWADSKTQIKISEFADYKTLHSFSQRHFNMGPASPAVSKYTKQLTDTLESTEAKANRIFSFIQKDVKYLSYGYLTPTHPDTVLRQLFGDCKSKSLLACKMLNSVGIKAFPFIVHSDGINLDSERFASLFNFDHCIVEFEAGGRLHYMDPTIAPQGGGVTEKYCPLYRKGLSIRSGADSLVAIPKQGQHRMVISDSISLNSDWEGKIGRSVKLTGTYADDARNWHAKGGTEHVWKRHDQYYEWNYKHYEQTPDSVLYLSYQDNDVKGNNKNEVALRSSFMLDWLTDNTDEKNEREIVLSHLYTDFREFENEGIKHFKLPYPLNMRHEIFLKGVDKNKVNKKPYSIQNSFLSFSKKFEVFPDGVKVIFEVETFDNYFKASDYAAYQKALKEIKSNSRVLLLVE